MGRLRTSFPKSHIRQRVDARSILNNIIFVGLRWRDAPRAYAGAWSGGRMHTKLSAVVTDARAVMVTWHKWSTCKVSMVGGFSFSRRCVDEEEAVFHGIDRGGM